MGRVGLWNGRRLKIKTLVKSVSEFLPLLSASVMTIGSSFDPRDMPNNEANEQKKNKRIKFKKI